MKFSFSIILFLAILSVVQGEISDLTSRNVKVIQAAKDIDLKITIGFVSDESKVPSEVTDIAIELTKERKNKYIEAILESKPIDYPSRLMKSTIKLKIPGEIKMVFQNGNTLSIGISNFSFFWGDEPLVNKSFFSKKLALMIIDDLKKIKSEKEDLSVNIKYFIDSLSESIIKYKEEFNCYTKH